ncbi:hypothetical protein Cob_v013158 [Colletotrichum orbiculare MAFF 240422]|uniref:Uncharacterized protein n=1 Tax=Colletotrichum orbiculare (strain 104-T / ATCC 96160 / CBS 514.97 / LARS 414 / MAFF 240422) TaxID=1213857 RepID=A0A484F6Q8_COLOR|nr:hypothetical protein Cob_v013158 [Colletotrichum orbiculare MAFF 240422]
MTTTTDPNPLTTQRGGAPLTTVFTTPDFCNSLYWTDTITPPLSSIVCMPTSWKQVYEYSWGFYSPGICPSGYTEGCAFPTTRASRSNGNVYLGGPVIEGETARLCCPTGHTCYSGSDWPYSKCLSTVPTTSYFNSMNEPTSALATVFAVQVRWQASDLSNLETDPTVPGATYTGPRSTSGASATVSGTDGGGSGAGFATATATATPEGSGGGGGISVAATVGIAVGAVVGTLVLALVAFMIWWRRRRRREDETRTHRGDNDDARSDSMAPPVLAAHKAGSDKTSLDIVSPGTGTMMTASTLVGTMDAPRSPTTTTNQLDSTTLMEMETMERPQELPEDCVVELEGDMPGPPLYREKEGWPLRSIGHNLITTYSNANIALKTIRDARRAWIARLKEHVSNAEL